MRCHPWGQDANHLAIVRHMVNHNLWERLNLGCVSRQGSGESMAEKLYFCASYSPRAVSGYHAGGSCLVYCRAPFSSMAFCDGVLWIAYGYSGVPGHPGSRVGCGHPSRWWTSTSEPARRSSSQFPRRERHRKTALTPSHQRRCQACPFLFL